MYEKTKVVINENNSFCGITRGGIPHTLRFKTTTKCVRSFRQMLALK